MGRHKEWRKLAKKSRRKRKRQQIAAEKAEIENKKKSEREASPTYIKMCAEQEALEKFQEEEEVRLAEEREEQWLKAEEEAQKQWKELQIRLAQLREERAKEEERILQEWKREQLKIFEEKERRRKLKEENERKAELIKNKIDEFISNGGNIPEELEVSMETNPNKEICPFFHKTATCRFKDTCSRNHIRPGISKVLLFPAFYSHFSLYQGRDNEHGTDSSLEVDERETYNNFKEFFNDVLPEMEKCGHVNQFKVCRNIESHLRGNVYVEYERTRDALKAFKMFQGRWYGGRQINVEFCNIESWRSAICGLSFKKKCPKGSTCNFLHVFTNPFRMFEGADRDLHRNHSRNNIENESDFRSREWRWSESPERNVDDKENRNNRHSRSCRKHKHYDKRRDRKKISSSRSRSRSKSPSVRRRKKRKHSH